jgi:membrane protein YqaA with SNARE-associated domain
MNEALVSLLQHPALTQNPTLHLVLAQFMSVFVYMLIYLGGRLLFIIVNNSIEKKLLQHVSDFRQEFGSAMMLSLLLCWTPFGSIFAVMAGFLRTPVVSSFILILLGQGFYVLYQLWQAGALH